MIHDTIKQRLRASLLLGPAAGETLAGTARLARELRSDGTWRDVDYRRVPTVEAPPVHLERTLALARARRDAPGALDAALRRALDFWLAHDFQFADWRCNQRTVPRLVGQTALLAENELSPGAREKIIEVLTRSRLSRWVPGAGWQDWTGTDLLGMAYNVVLRGCLEDAPFLFDGAFRQIFHELRLVGPGENGIQADLQFHGPHSAHFLEEGLMFAREIAGFIALAQGTLWQAPAEGVKLFAAFLLDAQQWMVRPTGGGNAHAAEAGAASRQVESLAAAAGQLAQVGNPPRRQELVALSYRLAGEGAPLTGQRYFWRSGLVVHHRPGYGVRLHLGSPGPKATLSEPDIGSPPGKGFEGGTEFLPPSGQEDWAIRRQKDEILPGMTIARPSVHPARPGAAPRTEERPGAAVSDGEYGAAALRLAGPALHGKKAWFFFDDSLVCLGSGLRTSDAHAALRTLVDERGFHGYAAVWLPGDGKPTPLRAPDRVQARIEQVEHAGFLYHFAGGAMVSVQAADVPDESSAKLPAARFSLEIEHEAPGRAVAGYAYTVLPCGGAGPGQARAAELSQLEVLANSPALQAVRHRALRLVQVIFWEAGVLRLPDGNRVAANQPCLLLCREDRAGETRLTVANPAPQPTILHVEYGGRCQCFDLPGAHETGRSLSRVF